MSDYEAIFSQPGRANKGDLVAAYADLAGFVSRLGPEAVGALNLEHRCHESILRINLDYAKELVDELRRENESLRKQLRGEEA